MQKIKIETIQLDRLQAGATESRSVYKIVKITNSVDWDVGQELERATVRDILANNSNVEIIVRKPKNSDFN